MLHFKDWFSGKKSLYLLTLGLITMAVAATSCDNKKANEIIDNSDKAFSGKGAPHFIYDSIAVKNGILTLCDAEQDSSETVVFVKNYYRNGGNPLWINTFKNVALADSLIAELSTVSEIGFNPEAFDVPSLQSDRMRIDSLDFNDSTDTFNNVLGRLEYRLTKAYIKYTAGQRFGFLKPHTLFNRLDKRPRTEDPTGRTYRRLFHVDTEQADSVFYAEAIQSLRNDTDLTFLRSTLPTDTLYLRLKQELASADSLPDRMRLICNMDRLRWRKASAQNRTGRHIVVNIPAFHLYAVGGDTLLDMRIVCGTRRNKTPLLTSQIERMELNPLWSVPKNIIKGELAYHAGDSAYFAEDNYVITSLETGDTIAPKETTYAMLRSGKYAIAQKRGPGNSLGRIVFRFPNPFAVYLHDTSAKGAFRREVRSLSHGCVRVQKPFELAEFVLKDADDWTLDKIRISMDIKPESAKGKKWLKEKNKELEEQKAQMGDAFDAPRYHSLMKHKEIRPTVPLYIVYHTVHFDHEGKLQTYPDIYGYDAVMSDAIKPLVK